MLFGIDIPANHRTDVVSAARRAERLGFDFVSTSDHPGLAENHEVWTMLTWIAAKTNNISVATRVLGVPLRNPALTGKMAATLDRLSEGRVILGLGGGAGDDELRAFGIPVPTSREKIDRLAVAVQRIRDDFSGPVWLGTFGPRALATTGQTADGWIPSRGYVPDEELPQMRVHVLDAAREAGRDPQSITCALNLSADASLDDLFGFVSAGFNAFNFKTDKVHDAVRLADEVLPVLRATSIAQLIEFRDGVIDAGDGMALERAMAAEMAEVYGWPPDKPGMPSAGADKLSPPDGVFLIGYEDDRPVCCGGVQRFDGRTCEFKRMYVIPPARGRGVARALLAALEARALVIGYDVARLNTGPKQPAAQHLYESAGYMSIPKFYENPVASFFGEKQLT